MSRNSLAHIRLQADKERLAGLKERLTAAAAAAGWGGEELNRFELVVEEAVINIMLHAYQGEPGGLEVELLADRQGELLLRLQDQGPAFNPLEAAAPDLSAPLDERRIGGLGVHFMQSLTDGMTYRREDGTNRLELLFRRRSAASCKE